MGKSNHITQRYLLQEANFNFLLIFWVIIIQSLLNYLRWWLNLSVEGIKSLTLPVNSYQYYTVVKGLIKWYINLVICTIYNNDFITRRLICGHMLNESDFSSNETALVQFKFTVRRLDIRRFTGVDSNTVTFDWRNTLEP